MNQLSRYTDIKAFGQSWAEQRTRLSQGAADAPPEAPGADATPEQIAEYRNQAGIPQEASGYLDGLPDGLVFGEHDEAALSNFTEAMHAQNIPPATVHQMLGWYQGFQEDAAAQMAQQDEANRSASAETLREDWGPDFKANLQSTLNFVNTTAPTMEDGSKFGDALMAARLPDGSLVGDNPHALRWLNSLAHEQNPAGFVAPGSGLNQEQSVNNEIAEIENLMKTDPPAYWSDNAKQERLRTLYEAREKIAGS